MHLIWVRPETKYFCKRGWTGGITMKTMKKLVWAQNAFRVGKRGEREAANRSEHYLVHMALS
jgi:hypothetical protein